MHLQHMQCRSTPCNAGARSLMMLSCVMSSSANMVQAEVVLYGCTDLSF